MNEIHRNGDLKLTPFTQPLLGHDLVRDAGSACRVDAGRDHGFGLRERLLCRERPRKVQFAAWPSLRFAERTQITDNRVDLHLQDLSIRSIRSTGAAGVSLQAVLAEPDPGMGREFKVGDRNVLRATMRNVSGNGLAKNVFAVATGPVHEENLGVGNRLEIAGDPLEFARFNTDFGPLPDALYFEHRTGD